MPVTEKDLCKAWKRNNATVVSARLGPDLYRALWTFCHRKGFSFNSGIKHLIATHPETN